MKEARNAHGVWPFLALLVGILGIAWSAILVRWTNIPGPASAFCRRLIPALVLSPSWFFDRNRERADYETLGIIALGGLFFALDLAFFNTSILLTSAANATILGNNTPIFVGLLTWLLFRRRPSLAYWLGLALAIARSLVSLAIPRGHTWAALLGLTYALGHLPATVPSVSLLWQVPLTAFLAAFLLAELLSGAQILGGALVLAGVGLANRRRHPAEEAHATLCAAGEHE